MSDKKIIDSWNKNATAWTTAIREEQIESRKLVTNRSIIDTVLAESPRSVLDLGCGEGWLVREVSSHGPEAFGVDVVPGLIEQARALGDGDFEVMSYEEISFERLKSKFSVVVSNFALLGNESVVRVFSVVPTLLDAGGALIIQTTHPVIACGDQVYEDGWRQGCWTGFSRDFTDPPPWYFRKLETWVKLFTDNGFTLGEIKEPIHPTTGKPASVILVGRMA